MSDWDEDDGAVATPAPAPVSNGFGGSFMSFGGSSGGGGGGHLGKGESAIIGIGGALVRRQLGDRSVLVLREETTAAVPGQGHHGLEVQSDRVLFQV